MLLLWLMKMGTQKYSVMKMPALLCENLGVKLGHHHKVPSKLLDVQMVSEQLDDFLQTV